MSAQNDDSNLKRILLVFTHNIYNDQTFNEIIDGFKKNEYIIHNYEIENELFEYQQLKEVITDININYQGLIEEVVVISNVRELLLLWYRIYNSIVDNFIYYLDDKEPLRLKNIINDDILMTLSRLHNISEAEVEGKIYINLKFDNSLKIADLIFYESNFEYFTNLKYFDYQRSSKSALCRINNYIYKGSEVSFLEHIKEESERVIVISLDLQSPKSFDEKRFMDLLSSDPEFLVFYMCYLYRNQTLNHAYDICKNMLSYIVDNTSAIVLYNLISLFFKAIENNEISFIQKGQFISWVMFLKTRINPFKLYYELLNRWVWVINQKKTLAEYFIKNSIKNIAIYGLGELGKRVYEELVKTDINIICFIDKKAEHIKLYQGKQVIWLDRKDILTGIEVIVVTPVYDFYDIKHNIEESLNNIQIISLKEVVFET